MCHRSVMRFGAKSLSREEIEGKRIIEIGSLNVNGSLKSMVEEFKPRTYVGVDIKKGNGVNVICRAENVVDKFGKESFDFVISTELLEHVKDWKKVISNIKNVCKIGGIIFITTRSYGSPLHEFPRDFWRYELGDMQEIFSDYEILILMKDTAKRWPGVFLKAMKPKDFEEKDLSGILLYNMVKERRIKCH